MSTTESINVPEAIAEAAAEERQLCPLSFAQERLWFLNQLRPGNPAYNISQGWRLCGALDMRAFEGAVNAVIRRQESLRTTFARVEGKPVEIISAHRPRRIVPIDLSSEENPEEALRGAIRAAAHTRFDLEQGPLFRVDLFRLAASEHVVLFTLHHIISDAASFEILRREIAAAYEALAAGREPSLPELPVQYLDYAHWQRENLSAARVQDELAFWRDYLREAPARLELPFDNSPAADDTAGASVPFQLDRQTVDALRRIAQQEGATLFSALLAGFTALLHRWTGQRDLIVGTPVSTRDAAETENLVGFLVETIPVRTRIDGNPTFAELLRGARASMFDALAHLDTPFDEVVKALQPERTKSDNPLFQVVLALHGGFPDEWQLGDLRAALIDVATETAKFDLTLLLEECACGIRGRLEYKTDRFEADTAGRFLQQFERVLRQAAANPSARCHDFELLSAAEHRQVTIEWNNTASDYERGACVHELFEAQARRTPGAAAVQFGSTTLTYDALNNRANQLARILQARGVAPDTLVGVALERSADMIATLLAILKAGAVYVPLDRSYPRERLAFMIREANVRVIAGDGAFLQRLNPAGPQLLNLDEVSFTSEPAANLEVGSRPESLAYVMFTSGSTGNPKAAAIPHRAIARLVKNTNFARFAADDVFLQLAPVSFDASTLEIWAPLLNGGKLIVFPPHTPSLDELGRFIEESRVTTLWLTAGLFHQMIDDQLPRLRHVRQLLAGGDVLSVPHVLKALRELPQCQLINGYGPTENTTFTCCFPIPREWGGGRSVPIGAPIANTRVYVLDAAMKPAAPGAAGELFAGGDGLAQGYLGQPLLTSEKFVNVLINGKTERLYRTGDLVRWLPDGNLEFLGRADQQLKIRGFRIEPGEVEAAVSRHPNVRQAAVVARTAANGDRQLVAFVVALNATEFNEAELRAFAAETLPSYMTPSRFVAIPELPLTPNGKVDARALPNPDEPVRAGETAGPRDSVEETLCGIWKELLGRNGFGVNDNFFQLGGHSLLITQMLSRIARAFQRELPVRAVFESPTIAGLAETLRRAESPAPAATGIAPRRRSRAQAQEMLNRLPNLSDAEIETFLSRSK